MAVCWLLNLLFQSFFFYIILQITAPWCIQAFEMTRESNVYMNTPQSFYRLFRECCLVP